MAGVEDSDRQLLALLVFDVNPHLTLDQYEHRVGVITLLNDHHILLVVAPDSDVRKRLEALFIEGVIRCYRFQKTQHRPVCLTTVGPKLHHFR